jgi:signal transduction histidine kinase
MFSIFILASTIISLMPLFTGDGFASHYFGGNMLVILIASVIFNVSPLEFTILASGILFFHFTIISLASPFNYKEFMSSLFFLVSASLMGGILNTLVNAQQKREDDLYNHNQFFVKVFAHDIKNHLASGIANLQLLKQIPDDLTQIDTIIDDEKHINRIVGNLINIFSSDSLYINKQNINFTQLTEHLTKEWKPKFQTKKITFELINAIPTDLPIRFDNQYMQLVWDNLLANSYQNTPSEGKIIIRFFIEKTSAVFSFANSGEIIPESLRATLFNKHLHSEKHTPYSKGLGLHYSKMMCDLHGGDILYIITPENLNEFRVKLPLY